MTPDAYRRELTRAKVFHGVDTANAGYWTGYIRGLARLYYGRRFGSLDEHRNWMADLGERGRGYREGLQFKPQIKDKAE